MTRIVFIHTVPGLADVFEDLRTELLPGVESDSVVAPHLLQQTVDSGRLAEATIDELGTLVSGAAAGADAIMVTCSTLGPAVDAIRDRFEVPVLRVDDAMARRAVRSGRRVGVLATLPTTLEPTVGLLERVAAAEGRDITIRSKLCTGAFKAVVSGDVERHDQLVRDGLAELIPQSDVIVLAQASMARAVDSAGNAPEVPVLTSPRPAVEELRDSLT